MYSVSFSSSAGNIFNETSIGVRVGDLVSSPGRGYHTRARASTLRSVRREAGRGGCLVRVRHAGRHRRARLPEREAPPVGASPRARARRASVHARRRAAAAPRLRGHRGRAPRGHRGVCAPGRRLDGAERRARRERRAGRVRGVRLPEEHSCGGDGEVGGCEAPGVAAARLARVPGRIKGRLRVFPSRVHHNRVHGARGDAHHRADAGTRQGGRRLADLRTGRAVPRRRRRRRPGRPVLPPARRPGQRLLVLPVHARHHVVHVLERARPQAAPVRHGGVRRRESLRRGGQAVRTRGKARRRS